MSRRRERLRFLPQGANVFGRATAHLARPTQRRRRSFQFERLEERLAMAGDLMTEPTLATSGLSVDSAALLADPLRIASADTVATNRLLLVDSAANTDVHSNYVVWYNHGYDYLEVDADRQDVPLDVLANDFSHNWNLDLEIVAVEQPAQGGTLAIAEDGKSLLFSATPGFAGYIDAKYTVRFGPGEQDVMPVGMSITVTRPFLALDDFYAVDPADGAATLDVVANELRQASWSNTSGADRVLRIVSTSAGSQGGQVAISEDGGSLIYQAASGFTGDERITYEIEDQFGNRDQAEVYVHVAPKQSTEFPAYHPDELRVRMLEIAARREQGRFGVSYSLHHYLKYAYPREYLTLATNSAFLNRAANDTVATGTNTQVAGVDEADLIESDGRYLYTFSKGRLTIVDIQDPSAMRLISVTDLSMVGAAMFLDNGRLTIISQIAPGQQQGNYFTRMQTGVKVFDVADSEAPRLVQHLEIDGQVNASRSIDGRVYLVVSEGIDVPSPEIIEITHDDGTKSMRFETWEEYAERFKASAFETALPGYRSYDAEGELIASGTLTAPGEILKPIVDEPSSFVSVVAIDVHSDVPGPVAATTWRDGFIANDSVYVNQDNLYIWSTEGPWTNNESTFIRQLHIGNSASIDLVATGRVAGRVVDQFSFDEHDGYLRVVTTSQQRMWSRLTAEVNDLYVLEEVGSELIIVGQVSDFARNESVRSVRFDGERALVVTFPDRIFDPLALPRDPLFVIDLSDPTAPTIEGELEVPGFSSYLEVINEGQLLGFGSDIDPESGENRGVILSLFHTDGFNEPTILDQFRFELDGVETSIALNDHRAISYYPEHQIVTVPIFWREPIDGDMWNLRERNELWVLKVDSATGKLELLSRINHDTSALRTLQVGDVLLTISEDAVTSHVLSNPIEETGRLYFGDLPVDDQFTQTEDTGPWTLDVLANDRLDEQGEHAAIVSVTQPEPMWNGLFVICGDTTNSGTPSGDSAGTVSIAEDGQSIVFTPSENFFGVVSFTYTVFDEVRGFQTATVTIAVENVTDDVEANDDTFDVEPGAQSVSLNVLANDVDPDASRYGYGNWAIDFPVTNVEVLTLSTPASLRVTDVAYWYGDRKFVAAVSSPDQGGTVEIDASGRGLRYTPAAGFVGTETFTYTIQTFDGRTDTATVTIRVGDPVPAEATSAPPAVVPPGEELPTEELPTVELPAEELPTLAEPTATVSEVAETAEPTATITEIIAPTAALPETDPAREVAPAERTETLASTTEVALPRVGDVPPFAVRSVATAFDRAAVPRSPLSARAVGNDLLNLTRSTLRRSVASSDDAFATLDRGSEVDGELAEDLAQAWVALPGAI